MEGRVAFQAAGECTSLQSAMEVFDFEQLQAIRQAVDGYSVWLKY
jgi:hypothetical protein